jgi:hypothetical protein
MDRVVDNRFQYGYGTDTPLVGDFNNDGLTDIGVFRSGQWILDYEINGVVERRFQYGLGTDIPIVGKWNSASPIPTINNIVPDEGVAGIQIIITELTGTNFQSGAAVTLIKSGNPNITASNVNVQSSTLISCTFSPPMYTTPGSWDVVVTNPDGQTGIYTNLFTIRRLYG